MKVIRIFIVAGLAVGFLGANLVPFQVDITEAAIVTQFGDPVRVVTEPGLHAKLPDPVQSVQKVNTQLQVFDLPETEFLAADKKNVVVSAYATWKVTDPLAFVKNVRDIVGAVTRLEDIVKSELGAALGKVELGNLVTVDHERMRLDDMLDAVRDGVAKRTVEFGFTVTDVQLKQLGFPEANLPSVFQRMRSEREAIARKFRSEGTEQAARIRAGAETERAEIAALASREATEIRGRADAEAIAVYADAFGRDPDFYRFLRTLDAYEKFIDESTTLILPADSELLRYLNPTASDERRGSALARGTGATAAQ